MAAARESSPRYETGPATLADSQQEVGSFRLATSPSLISCERADLTLLKKRERIKKQRPKLAHLSDPNLTGADIIMAEVRNAKLNETITDDAPT